MRILAIDAALPAVSACVLDSADRTPLSSETHAMARGHAEALMPIIERVVGATDGGFAALDRIAVTVGPGSFTGIRVGLSAARAIGLALGKPVVGVSTLNAFVAPLLLACDDRRILACVDARHGQSYAQLFGSNGQALGPSAVLRHADAVALMGGVSCRVAGTGAPAVLEAALARGIKAEAAGDLVAPPIAFVAMLGCLMEPGDGRPRPLYLKAVDATPMSGDRSPATV